MRVAASRCSRALVLLAALLGVVALSSTLASAAAQHAAPVKHVLMVSIPLPGHLNPLIAQGMELRRRGWAVTLASPSRLRKHIEAAKTRAAKESNGPNGAALLPLQSLDLGDCAAIAELTATLERAAGHEDYMASAREMLEWSLSLHHCMYKGLSDQLVHLSPAARPSVIVADFATYAAFDIADRFGLPLVINNPDLLNTLSPDDVAPYDFIPGTMTGTSLAEHASEDRWYGLLERALYPPLRVLLRYMAAALFESELHRQQSLAGVVPTPFFSRMSGRLLLVNGAFGLEYARPLPPNVIMVGHMSEKPWRNDLHQARNEYEEELSEEDRTWLASPVAGASSDATIASTDAAALDGSNVPVIWVSMGTISPLNERQALALYSAFERGTRAGHFRVLWKLERRDHAFLPPVSARPSPDQLRLVDWVSSQLGVLAHPATQLFISHCGINSVHESVYLEKGLLCIPILADQADMAVRVKDAHVGVHLSKSAFTGDELLENLLALLRPANSSALSGALRRTRHAMLLSGGVERASNFIEYAAQFGIQALVPIDVSHPWWVRHHLDMYAVWTMLLLLSAAAVHTCCCRLRPGKQCVESRKDMRAKGKAHAKITAANAAQQSKQD